MDEARALALKLAQEWCVDKPHLSVLQTAEAYLDFLHGIARVEQNQGSERAEEGANPLYAASLPISVWRELVRNGSARVDGAA